MLETLAIRDIVLIERLDLDFDAGLNVLTGETGAGKSILLDALGFALGRRDGKGLLREGAEEGGASASFDCPDDHPARALVEEAGARWDADGLILRRTLTAGGRARAFLNDQRVSADTLRAVGEALVEVHGQHDDRGLLNPRGHRVLLDAFAGAEAELTATRAAWAALRQAEEALEAAKAAQEAAARDRDFLAHAVAELREAAPEPGEDAALDARRRLMQAAERIRGDVAAAKDEADAGEAALSGAARRLSAAAEATEGALEPAIEALARAQDAAAEAIGGIEAALNALDVDPFELERVEERLFHLRALARKHQSTPEELPSLAAALAARFEAIEGGDAEIARLEEARAAAEADYETSAAALSAVRASAAKALDQAVAQELPPLKMERAEFATILNPGQPGPDGRDHVEFQISTNPGAPMGALGAIASGGELSRFLLALKVALAARTGGGAMVFDEIDRGVGGATADAVGRRLSRLAEGAQVLVVTHSPQVAACGDAHFRIQKSVIEAGARTNVAPLTGDARRDEIARMLAGDEITDAARAAADALIG